MIGGGFFGSGGKSSESFGGALGSADNLATNNAGAYVGAPVINFMDGRAASGKYARNEGGSTLALTMTDHGALSAAMDFAGSALAGVGNTLGAMLSTADRINERGAFQNLELARYSQEGAAHLIDTGAVQNLEFLGEVGKFSELTAMVQLENARLAERQAAAAMEAAAAANQRSLTFAEGVTNSAMNGILANTKHSTNLLAEYQNAALEQVAEFGQQSQYASERAMDYVFESSKSEQARLSEVSTKWAIGAAVLVAGMMVWAGAKR